jgi:hypothetical protein
LQFHIWLAGDTKGILVIVGPSQWRWVSFIFGTILFVFLSWKVASVTGTITNWIMGNQKKPATVAPVAPIASAPIAPAPAADGEKATENDVEKTESPVSPESQEPLLPPPVTSSRELSLNEKLIRVLGIYWEDLGFRTTAIILAFWFINLVQPLTIILTQIYP